MVLDAWEKASEGEAWLKSQLRRNGFVPMSAIRSVSYIGSRLVLPADDLYFRSGLTSAIRR